ncbi:hypothetical protein QRT05_06585 [Cellulomonas sp. MW9]|uniref:Uncharacterized protein n=1 Tax=Cellulomonas edaphi TaxID=3053468 RepID=A0ABT7S660_9CELL|nr:hypothetical protein [Cellulomons edaphi]MDM7830994.1 hypothetical protein [Cellulomons edaphi]
MYATSSTIGPNRPPGRSWNASGIASVATNAAAIATPIPIRSGPWSAGDWLASQLYDVQVHHMKPSTVSAWTTPRGLWVSVSR